MIMITVVHSTPAAHLPGSSYFSHTLLSSSSLCSIVSKGRSLQVDASLTIPKCPCRVPVSVQLVSGSDEEEAAEEHGGDGSLDQSPGHHAQVPPIIRLTGELYSRGWDWCDEALPY